MRGGENKRETRIYASSGNQRRDKRERKNGMTLKAFSQGEKMGEEKPRLQRKQPENQVEYLRAGRVGHRSKKKQKLNLFGRA